MKLKFLNYNRLDGNLKATVHKTGRMAFSKDAIVSMNLDADMGFMVAVNEDDESDKNLYTVLLDECQDGAFKVYKAGDYFYINLKPFLEHYKIDYKGTNIVYDISKEKIEGEDMYVFKMRGSDNDSDDE